MSTSLSIWLVIVLAFLGANLPFISSRFVALVPLARPKSAGLRLAELVLMYFLVGGLGLMLEARAGQIAPQGWEFYAITAALFIVFAFPGFVWRYLRRHRQP